MSINHFEKTQMFTSASFVALTITLSQLTFHEFIRQGRFQHALISTFIFIIIFLCMGGKGNKLIPAILGTLFFGLAKEFFDPSLDKLDMVANVTGIMLGILLTLSLNLQINKSRH